MASAAASLSGSWAYHVRINRWWVYGVIAFFTALSAYNFQRIYKLKSATPQTEWLVWVQLNKKYLTRLTFVSAVIGSILMILFTTITAQIILLLACLTLITVLYVVPIGKKSLREIAGLKIFLVAFVWTGLLVVYPMLNGNIPLEPYWKEITGLFLFFFAVTIPFDIRDLKFDLPSQKTLPQMLGVKESKILASAFILIFFVFTANFNQEIWKTLLLALFCLSVILLIAFTKPQRSAYFFATIDAMIILLGWWFFVLNIGTI